MPDAFGFPELFAVFGPHTIESIMTNISFPDGAIAYIVQYYCSKYNI